MYKVNLREINKKDHGCGYSFKHVQSGVLENFTNFTGKHLRCSVFLVSLPVL